MGLKSSGPPSKCKSITENTNVAKINYAATHSLLALNGNSCS